MPTPLTFLGHASFRLDSPGGKRIYIDPWLTGNPKCPEAEQQPERVDLIALTHGHGDHLGDTIRLWNEFKPPVIALVELRGWLEGQGVESSFPQNPNKGGTVDVDGVKLTFTDANHSSSVGDGTYAGEPAGIVLELEDGFKLYFAGDTNVFGDMALIRRHLRSRTWPCSRSAATSRWPRPRRRSRWSCSESSAACRATTAPSRS